MYISDPTKQVQLFCMQTKRFYLFNVEWNRENRNKTPNQSVTQLSSQSILFIFSVSLNETMER